MSAAAAGAAAQAAVINAIRSFGVVITVSPPEFQKVLDKQEAPLVVISKGGFFAPEYRYLVSHKGFAFFAKSPTPFELPSSVEIIKAESLNLPG